MTKAQKRYLDLIQFDGWMIGRETVEQLLKIVPVGSTVLELGGGVGTAVLRAFYDVKTFENDAEWRGFNSYYAVESINGDWYDFDERDGRLFRDYDCIIIDGPKKTYKRDGFIEHMDKFNLDVPIVVDDTEREAGKRIVKAIEKATGRKGKTYSSKKPKPYNPKKFTIV